MTSLPGLFICAVSGQSHVGAPTDSAFTLPDTVWAPPPEERVERAKWTTDLCRMGEFHFIRCLLENPFTDQPGYYGWGAWVQVEKQDLLNYLSSTTKTEPTSRRFPELWQMNRPRTTAHSAYRFLCNFELQTHYRPVKRVEWNDLG